MIKRNRSDGWKHAKKSGHKNEGLIAQKINKNKKFADILKSRLGKEQFVLKKAITDDIKAKHVKDVCDSKTIPKPDLRVIWKGNNFTNISIKKSIAGQVFLIGTDRFISGFEKQFNLKIPKDVERALSLFINGALDIDQIISNQSLNNINGRIIDYEKRKGRLTWETLNKYDDELADCLIEWLKKNIRNIILFCFQRGLAKNKTDWAEYVWYYNLIKENQIDSLLNLETMAEELSSVKLEKEFYPGKSLGGTTIHLPFGFLQWHQKKMQFHHNMDTILKNCKISSNL